MLSLIVTVRQCYCDNNYDPEVWAHERHVKTNDEDIIFVSSLPVTRQYSLNVLLTDETAKALVHWYDISNPSETGVYINRMLKKIKLCKYIPMEEEYYNIISLYMFRNIQNIKNKYNQMISRRFFPKRLYLSITVNNGDSEIPSFIELIAKQNIVGCDPEWTVPGHQIEDLVFSVHLKNDHSVIDREGMIHTWLIIDGKDGTKLTRSLFSFSNNDIWGLSMASGGKSTADKELFLRQATQTLTIPTSEIQYNQLKTAVRNFYNKNPKYQLRPEGTQNAYNCVTACGEILHAAGINILQNIDDPREVCKVINREKIAQGNTNTALASCKLFEII